MIRALVLAVVLSVFFAWLPTKASAETFKLLTGETVEGAPVGPNAQGVVIKRPDGSFSQRIGWTNFNQEALKELAKSPQIKRHVDPLIEEEINEPEAKKAITEITINTPPRVERPPPKAGIGSLFSSPLSIFLLVILYAASLYGAYEISIFKNQPPGLLCVIAAVAPLIGPLVFLCLPRYVPSSASDAAEADGAESAGEVVVAAEPAHAHHGHATAAGHGGPPALGAAPTAGAHPAPQIYQRGQFTFNRRFFETKLAGWLKMVPSEAEKDMVLHVKSARGEHVASRIARINPNDVAFQITKGGASSEVIVPYGEISEVRVQHREA